MNYAELKSELSLPEYTGTLDDKREQYNAKMVTRSRRVPKADIEDYFLDKDVFHTINDSPGDTAKKIKLLFSSRRDGVDIARPPVAQGLTALVGGGILTQTQADEIVAMGTEMVHVSQTKPGLPLIARLSDVIKSEAL